MQYCCLSPSMKLCTYFVNIYWKFLQIWPSCFLHPLPHNASHSQTCWPKSDQMPAIFFATCKTLTINRQTFQSSITVSHFYSSARNFCMVSECLIITNNSCRKPVIKCLCYLSPQTMVIHVLIIKILLPRTNVFPIIREIKSSQIKVSLQYIKYRQILSSTCK